MTPMRWLFAALSLALAAACDGGTAGPAAPAAAPAAPSIDVGNAFVMVPLEGRDVTMAGLDIAVRGQDVRLAEVRTTFAERAELHTMSMVDDRMTMRQVDGFDIPAGETFQLKRGGDHIMLCQVDPLEPDEAYDLTLIFEYGDGHREVVNVPARAQTFGE